MDTSDEIASAGDEFNRRTKDPILCQFCAARFNKPRYLKSHMKNKHEKDYIYHVLGS